MTVKLLDPINTNLEHIGLAVTIAQLVHGDQLDKGGEPALWHVLRVANTFSTNQMEFVVGLLHDVIEDSDMEAADIEILFGSQVASAVERLTRRKGTSFRAYIATVARDPVCRRVKLADLADNLRIERLLLAEKRGANVSYLVRKYVGAVNTLIGAEI